MSVFGQVRLFLVVAVLTTFSPISASAARIESGKVLTGRPRLYLPPAEQVRLDAARAAQLRTRQPHIAIATSPTSPTLNPNPYPDAHLTYQGGALVVDPTVYLVGLTTDGSPALASNFVPGTFATGDPGTANAVTAIFHSAWYQSWSSEYSTPQYQLGGGQYGGTVYLAAPTIATAPTVTDAQITSTLVAAANAGTLPSGPNVVDVLFFTNAQTVVMNDGTTSATGFCAYHNYVYTGSAPVNYVVIPDEQGASGCNPVGQTYPAFDAQVAVLSHELAELITDPNPGYGWVDPEYRTELVDLCSPLWYSTTSTTSPTYAYPVEMVFSNLTGGCAAGPDPTTITVTQSGSQVGLNLSDWTTPLVDQPLSVTVGNAAPVTMTTDASGNVTVTLPSTWVSTDTLTASFAGNALTLPSTVAWTTASGSPYAATSTDRAPNQSWTAPGNLSFTTDPSGNQIGDVPGFQTITVGTGVLGASVTIIGPTGRYTTWTGPSGVATFSIPVTGTADQYVVVVQPDAVLQSVTSVTVAAAPLHPVTPTKGPPKKTPSSSSAGTIRYPAWFVVIQIATTAAHHATALHRATTVADYALAARRVPGVTVRAGSSNGEARFTVRATKEHFPGSVCVTLPAAGGQPYLIGLNGSAAC